MKIRLNYNDSANNCQTAQLLNQESVSTYNLPEEIKQKKKGYRIPLNVKQNAKSVL